MSVMGFYLVNMMCAHSSYRLFLHLLPVQKTMLKETHWFSNCALSIGLAPRSLVFAARNAEHCQDVAIRCCGIVGFDLVTSCLNYLNLHQKHTNGS